MPNHIKNKLEIIGSEEQIKSVREFLKGEPYEDGDERFVDFNKIIPIPKVIEDVGEVHMGIVTAVKKKYNTPLHENSLIAGLEILNREKQSLEFEKQEDQEALERACRAYEETGYIYWYDWNIAKWGTKWNAYSIKAESDNVLTWETAWSCVLDLMKIISEKFPDVELFYQWADEDTGSNCGQAKIKNGDTWLYEPESGSNKAYELALSLWPDKKEYIKLIDGKYQYVDED